MLVVVPLTVAPLVMFLECTGTALSVFVGFLGFHESLVTVGLVAAAQSGEITIIVDPSDMAFRPFRAAAFLFPQINLVDAGDVADDGGVAGNIGWRRNSGGNL